MRTLLNPSEVRSLGVEPFYHHGDLQSVRVILILYILKLTV